MNILLGFIAFFIAWIWVDYYRLIDIYEKDKLKYFIIVFVLGALSVPLTFFIGDFVELFWEIELNQTDFVNVFLYSFFNVSLIEEIAKLLPIIVFYWVFRKQVNEPIDIIAYSCTGALGFATLENFFYYLQYGESIVLLRAIMSTLGHMMFTGFIAYGWVLWQFKMSRKPIQDWLKFFVFAIASHGVYDLFLFYQLDEFSLTIITNIYYLFAINWFAKIINNSLNNSPFFEENISFDSQKVFKRLLQYYAFVLAFQFALSAHQNGIEKAVVITFSTLFYSVFYILVASYRLSRFFLVKGKTLALKWELPFKPKTDKSSGKLYLEMNTIKNRELILQNYIKEHIRVKNLHFSSSVNPDFSQWISIKISHRFHNDEQSFFYKIEGADEELALDYYIQIKQEGEYLLENGLLVVGLFHKTENK
ncbi:MAG: PrsW family intramembrane metalloprotease [Flavobacteriales bacterium]|nr:PrsW family intramembrane metalloprotease [Flavobacteriales bacterium]